MLGSVWTAELDATASPGVRAGLLLARTELLEPGRVTPFGELLLELASDAPFRLCLPTDPSLAARGVSVQGALLGRDARLCNALRLVVGF